MWCIDFGKDVQKGVWREAHHSSLGPYIVVTSATVVVLSQVSQCNMVFYYLYRGQRHNDTNGQILLEYSTVIDKENWQGESSWGTSLDWMSIQEYRVLWRKVRTHSWY